MSKFYDLIHDKFMDFFSSLEYDTKKDIVDDIYTLGDDETPSDYLESLSGQELWSLYIKSDIFKTDLRYEEFDVEEILKDIIEENCWNNDSRLSFYEEFSEEIVSQMTNYTDPRGYFFDMARGGCASGMVGMFIYHSDCKEFYIKHIDDMEDYISEFESEMGCPIQNRNSLPRYTLVCWVCYEEFVHNVASILFEEDF